MSYSRSELLKILREDFVSVSIYRNIVDTRVYYDIVISRFVYQRQPNGSKKREWKRGANFKPEDLPRLVRLLHEAEQFVEEAKASPVQRANPDLSKLA